MLSFLQSYTLNTTLSVSFIVLEVTFVLLNAYISMPNWEIRSNKILKLTLPSVQVRTPCPFIIPAFHCPAYSLPSSHLNFPSPLNLSLWKFPSYHVLLVHSNSPLPSFSPLLHWPSYFDPSGKICFPDPSLNEKVRKIRLMVTSSYPSTLLNIGYCQS